MSTPATSEKNNYERLKDYNKRVAQMIAEEIGGTEATTFDDHVDWIRAIKAERDSLSRERDALRDSFDGIHNACGMGFPSWKNPADLTPNTKEIVAYIHSLSRERDEAIRAMDDATCQNAIQVDKLNVANRALSREVERLKGRIDSANKLYGITLANELRWMQKHTEVETERDNWKARALAAEHFMKQVAAQKEQG